MNKVAIRKEIIKYAGPGILGLVANSLYIVVDGVFVAKMLGANSLAAVTAVVPVAIYLWRRDHKKYVKKQKTTKPAAKAAADQRA